MELHWNNIHDWTSAPQRRGLSAEPSEAIGGRLSAELRDAGIEIAIQEQVISTARRGLERPPLDFNVDCTGGERAVTILRHASGAMTFHAPMETASIRRSGGLATTTLHFRIELPPQAAVRRSLISQGIKVIIAKIKKELIDVAVSAGLHAAALSAETLWWRKRGLTEGWRAIGAAPDGSLRLDHASAGDIRGKSLLFLHGTFSDTVGSYGGLLRPRPLAELLARYENRVFGFEHFSVSRSPEENARMLLDFLPDRENRFDVVSYSRGGLVLRTLAEHAAALGPASRRFGMDFGALVAVPNGGTPLATARRWEETFGLLANLLDLLPDNPLTPLTTAASFIADGLVWLAGHLSGDLPGLHAMDADSPTIASFQQRPASPPSHYSAIGANYQPNAALWQKLIDAGIDGFFDGANDLVVPSDGALKVDSVTPPLIPRERVACFGTGGNLRVAAANVHHLSILAQEETATFVFKALRGEAQELVTMDLSIPRPSRKPWRGAPAALPQPSFSQPSSAVVPSRQTARPAQSTQAADFQLVPEPDNREGDRTLQIMILGDADKPNDAQILAIYGSARVIEPFPMRNSEYDPDAGTRFNKIIRTNENIRMNVEGRALVKTSQVPELPSDGELRTFGGLLFETLFTRRVRRLYDLARSEQRSRPLNVIFTCVIPWLAAKPWEFAFDPYRRKFLATEELHFVRNVLTAVPAQRVEPGRKLLRMLVVEAQPAGTAQLSIGEEERQIRFRFQPLIDSGLLDVEVLAQATPGALHDIIVRCQLEKRPFDIVHFIGHGDFDSEADEGRLYFQAGDGGSQPVETQTLRELLCNRGIQIVFLNACDTARDAQKSLNCGVASALVEGGLPAVVANQYKVLDPSAVAFAQQFYWALANGATLGEAAREARIAVNYSIDGEIIDWAVPVLYARDPDRRLCEMRASAVPLTRAVRPAAAKPKLTRDGPAPIKIGIADLAHYFVDLGTILTRLNDVQSRFQFRLVDINTPMGVWENNAEENQTYLYAERFAEKLKDKPKALGVDLLGCITNWWMRDKETLGIYGWWSNDRDLPILILSTAGLDLPTVGVAAGRVIANEFVCGVAGWLVESNSAAGVIHVNGAKDCPFYYNEERDVKNVTGHLNICPTSRRLLNSKLPKKLDPNATLAAFDSLLRAFDGATPSTGKGAEKPKRKTSVTKPGKYRKRNRSASS